MTERSESEGTTATSIDRLIWQVQVPAAFAADEVEHQLRWLITRTTYRGFIVFARGLYYAQCAFYRELDPSSVVVEVISNTYLPPDRPLSKLQRRHIVELKFTQPSEKENFMMVASVESAKDVVNLAKVMWHVLENVLNAGPELNLAVSGQCW